MGWVSLDMASCGDEEELRFGGPFMYAIRLLSASWPVIRSAYSCHVCYILLREQVLYITSIAMHDDLHVASLLARGIDID